LRQVEAVTALRYVPACHKHCKFSHQTPEHKFSYGSARVFPSCVLVR
jgi:hypothetical protein